MRALTHTVSSFQTAARIHPELNLLEFNVLGIYMSKIFLKVLKRIPLIWGQEHHG